MNNKIEDLARTLLQSGIASSDSQARRMAEDMVGTEQKVQTDFDNKRDSVTMYGHTPKRPEKNPTDGSPVAEQPKVEEKPIIQIPKEENNPNEAVPSMTPEEYSAMQMQRAKSTEELIQEENLDKQPSAPSHPVAEKPVVQETSKEELSLDIPAPDSEDKAAMLEQMKEEKSKDLPNLNPLSEEPSQPQPNETAPKTEAPQRPEMTDERKKKIQEMEESKVDLSKVFKV